MTDREMLELAAKAAGIQKKDLDDRYDRWESEPVLIHRAWNPLTDDGDALRLAVKLEILNTRSKGYEWPNIDLFKLHEDDPYAATRRAITRAAAEIGKAMGEQA